MSQPPNRTGAFADAVSNASRELAERQVAALQDRAQIGARLEQLGTERAAALELADARMAAILETAARAIDAGMTITDIATLSGVSRQTLHSYLRSR